jgi:hypothetical protein
VLRLDGNRTITLHNIRPPAKHDQRAVRGGRSEADRGEGDRRRGNELVVVKKL